MAKKSAYISKGQRKNVARKTKILMKAERTKNPSLKSIMQKYETRQEIINYPRNEKQKALRDRYIQEENLEMQAFKLFEQYAIIDLKRAEIIQAIKTNYIEQLHKKWGPRLKEFKAKDKSYNMNSNSTRHSHSSSSPKLT